MVKYLYDKNILNRILKERIIMVMTPEELKKRRTNLGLTQKELSDKIEISQSILSKFESKRNFPGYHALKKIEENLLKIEHKEEKRVESIMIRNIKSLKPNDTVKLAIKLFKTNGYSQAPLIENEKVFGIITVNSLLDAKPSAKLIEIVEPQPPIIPKDTPISTAKMLLKQFPMILISEKGKIAGLITKEDML